MKSKANGQIKEVVVAMGPPRIVSSVIDDLCHWELLGWNCDCSWHFFYFYFLTEQPNICYRRSLPSAIMRMDM